MTRVGLRERKKAETRSRILQAAVELCAERGVHEGPVDEIAARADVGKGTVYNYFPAKDDLLVAFVSEIDAAALEGFAELGQSGTAAEVLDGAAWQLLSAKEPYREFVRVFMARVLTNDTFLAQLGDLQQRLDRAFAALLEALRERGLARADLTADEFGFAFKTLQMGLTCLWAIEGPPFAAARQMTRLHTHAFAREIAP